MGKFSDLWEEIHDKEVQLSNLVAEYEGERALHQGRPGLIAFINPAEDTACIKYDNGDVEWVGVEDITLI